VFSVSITQADPMAIQEDILDSFERIASIAEGAQRWVLYLVVFSLFVSAYLAWSAYSPDSALWWNIVKCGVLLLPALLWAFIYSILSELREAPTTVASLVNGEDGLLQNLNEFGFSKPQSLRGVFSIVRAFRRQEGLSVLFEAVSGIALIANPLFAIMALLALMALVGFVFIVPFVLIF